MNKSTTAPEGLNDDSVQLWLAGTGDYTVRAGDLWTLAWDGELLGHVMVASRKDGFFLGWPVTLPGEQSFAPGILVESSLGVTVTVWPTRETGLGLHLLERPLGHLLDVREIRRIAACLDEGEDPGMSFAPDLTGEARWEESSREMTQHWTELCFHIGRSDREPLFLDQEKIRELGGSAREIGNLLHLTPAETRTYWDAEQELPSPLAELLLKHYGVEAEGITRQSPALQWWDMLALPSYKAEVEAACSQRQESEEIIRSEVARSAYGLAARQDSDALADQKLRDAIRRTAAVGSNEAK